MIDVGLTGNVCSGYNTVADMFYTLHDVPIFDADVALKFLLNYKIDIMKNIKITFGDSVYDNGILNGDKFNTTEKFDRLIQIAEPELFKLYDNWKTKQSQKFKNSKILLAPFYNIFKSSILFERGFDKKMDKVITTFIPKDERAMKLAKETQHTLLSVYPILDAEMDELAKNRKADTVIHNYDSLSLMAQIEYFNEKTIQEIASNPIVPIEFPKQQLPKLLPVSTYSDIKNFTT